jgi:hypothetical protein
MKAFFTSLLLLLVAAACPLYGQAKLRHFGVYAGYNVNSIDHTALDHLTNLWNNAHSPDKTIQKYKDILRMQGLSGGLMAYHNRFYADFGFDVRKSSQLARFKDVVGEFQSQTLLMNAFHLGVGMNLNDGKDIVMITPGASFSIGRIEIKEGIYRTLADKPIPLTQKKPTAPIDDTKSMSALNTFASVFVNITIGKLQTRMPKIVIQPYLTIPLNKTDLTQAFYPPSANAYDPTLRAAQLTYWGTKIALAF